MANFASIRVTFTGGIAPTGLYIVSFVTSDTFLTGVAPHLATLVTDFAASTNALNSATSYRSSFLQSWGPGGVIKQFNCTVSQPYTSSPNAYSILISMQEYLNGNIVVSSSSEKLDFQITQEVKPSGLNVYVSSITEANANKCDNVRYNLTVEDGTPPYIIKYAQTGIFVGGGGPSFDFSRNSPNRNLQLVDSDGLTFDFQPPYVRSYSIASVTQEQLSAGTNIQIITSNNGIGSALVLEYSIDGTNWQASNSFLYLEPGNYSARIRDPYGCTTSFPFTVTAFQFQKIVAVHNTLNFEFKEPEATAPEYMDVRLFVNDVPVGDYKAHPYQRENGDIIYLFNADEIIRQYMPSIDDYSSLLNSAAQAVNMQAQIKLQKKKPADTQFVNVDIFLAINAARQIGLEGENLTDLVTNNENPFVFVEGQPGYIYVYDNQFYREKKLLTESANITVNGVTKFVEVLPYCDGDIVLKYLDKNGMYRFYKFSRFYARNVRGELIGSVENVFTSLSNGQGFKKNIGYSAQEELTVKANAVPASHMESLQDIYTSARVYMHIGNHGDDALKDWVLVDVEGDGLIKHNKRQFNDIELTIKPPKRNNVTML